MPPTPKRSSERRRRNAVPGETIVKRSEVVAIPALPGPKSTAGAAIHPVARRWYNALKQSGQSDFYEPSDWAAARYVCEAMSINLSADRFSAQLFAVVWSAMDDLLVTEAARRRARLEVERGITEPEGEKPISIEDRKKALGG